MRARGVFDAVARPVITVDRRDPWAITVAAVVTALTGAFFAFGGSVSAQERQEQERPEATDARQLFQRDCAVCHGASGQGTTRAPAITEAGTAAVDYMVRTGRMPPPNAARDGYRVVRPLERTDPAYSEEQIQALVEHTATFVDGPEVPEVNLDGSLEGEGGELFRLNCASCHQFAGNGGVLIDDEAPTIRHSTPIEVAEAIRVGPGTMPAFPERLLSDEEVDAIASYVDALQRTPDPGGIALLHFGPFSEGAVAWIVGIGALLATAKWIGRRT